MATYYDLTGGKLEAVIFNHYSFWTGLSTRSGTFVDRNKIRTTLHNLGFSVKECNNYCVSQIQRTLQEISARTNIKCLVIVILTHGAKNGYLHAYDGHYHKNMMYEIFQKSLHMEKIPKLFFIQACRGEKIEKGQNKPDVSLTGPPIYFMPQEDLYLKNMMCQYSTYERFVSFRDHRSGSWYIAVLCKVLNDATLVANNDLASLLIRVNKIIAEDFTVPENNTKPDLSGGKQMPQIEQNLTKLIKLSHIPVQA